jgi:hypothetical protein
MKNIMFNMVRDKYPELISNYISFLSLLEEMYKNNSVTDYDLCVAALLLTKRESQGKSLVYFIKDQCYTLEFVKS